MRVESTYSFSFPASKTFKLVYGDRAYVEEHLVPERDLLGAAYPNPFASTTLLPFTVTHNHTHVTLKVYNVLGQEIITLLDQLLEVGFYKIPWNGSDSKGTPVQSGTYIYQLQSNDGHRTQSQSRKLIFK
jgi:flagellar hook assembly protein FlgD